MTNPSDVLNGPFRFFEHGEVSVAGHDAKSQQVILLICAPCCLMHAITPLLLGAGAIDRYSVMNPVAVWIPQLSEERFHPEYVGADEKVCSRANRMMSQKVQEVLNAFGSLTPTLRDPSDIVPMLPLGTYVRFRYRCGLAGLAGALIEMEKQAIAGVAEIQCALAGAMTRVLAEVSSAGE